MKLGYFPTTSIELRGDPLQRNIRLLAQCGYEGMEIPERPETSYFKKMKKYVDQCRISVGVLSLTP